MISTPSKWHHTNPPTHPHVLSPTISQRLLQRRHLPLPPLGVGLSAGLGVHKVIPPPKGRGVVADKLLVVDVVVLRAGPERQDVVQAPGELVAAVRIHRLQQPQHDPRLHREEVQVARQVHPQQRRPRGAQPQHQHLDRGCVLGRQPKGRRVRVVQLVDRSVQRRVVHQPVRPVVPRVLEHEEDGDVQRNLPGRREGHVKRHAAVDGHGVEHPDLGQLDGEVAQEDQPRAVKLLLDGWDFGLFWGGLESAGCMGWRTQSRLCRNVSPTCWILYFWKIGMLSMMIHGIDLPKYTTSWMINVKSPVAKTSFCIQVYQV